MPRNILLPMLIGTVPDAGIALGVLLPCVVVGAAGVTSPQLQTFDRLAAHAAEIRSWPVNGMDQGTGAHPVRLLRGGDGDRANAGSAGVLRSHAGAHRHPGGRIDHVGTTTVCQQVKGCQRPKAEGRTCLESGLNRPINAKIRHRLPQQHA